MYLIYSPPWIGFSFMSSSCGNSPGSLCNYELSAGLWQWIRSKGWATLTTCRAAHCVLEGWTEHLGCEVYPFTVDLESSYFYGLHGKAVLKPACEYMYGISDLLKTCFLPAVSFQHFISFLTRTRYPWWISSYFIPAVPILVSILFIFVI